MAFVNYVLQMQTIRHPTFQIHLLFLPPDMRAGFGQPEGGKTQMAQ
jgi:hypothetical protein